MPQTQPTKVTRERTPSPPKRNTSPSSSKLPPQPTLQPTTQTTTQQPNKQLALPTQTQPPSHLPPQPPTDSRDELAVLRDLAMRSKQKSQPIQNKQANQTDQPKPQAMQELNRESQVAQSSLAVDQAVIESPIERAVEVDEVEESEAAIPDASDLIFSSRVIYHTTSQHHLQDAFGAISQQRSKDKKRGKRTIVSVTPSVLLFLLPESCVCLVIFGAENAKVDVRIHITSVAVQEFPIESSLSRCLPL